TVVLNGLPAFTSYSANLPLNLTTAKVDPAAPEKADYRRLINDSLKEALPFVSGRTDTRIARRLVSSGAPVVVLQRVVENADSLLGDTRPILVPLSDTVELYLKGIGGSMDRISPEGDVTIALDGKTATMTTSAPVFAALVANARVTLGENAARLRTRVTAIGRSIAQQERQLAAAEVVLADAGATPSARERASSTVERAKATLASLRGEVTILETRASDLETRAKATTGSEELTREYPSLFVRVGDGVIKVTQASDTEAKGDVLIPLTKSGAIANGEWLIETFARPEAERKISDKEIVWTEALRSAGFIESGWNTLFFSRGASREPEMAGIWGAVVGSFLTMVVTLLLSFPVGVGAAIYLEEFAPKNRLTDLIEVNINNLAAVPSIVFGLLGLAVFLNFAEFPRSAPLVGGMVLALMTLPTIIIASRAALKSVPPSIREAALGVGASKLQTVFHHVLPLAMPGMLTGTIIGMAQALGETAPLLMIGMVAFIVDVPGGFTDPATVLPVQIYMWADFPEIAFQQKTSAAIMILLGFLVIMNALAVLLRKRFERRW
ncbi:MAG: phosphate ABC transporter permease PstA, partial [Pseudomonadota bacterium]